MIDSAFSSLSTTSEASNILIFGNSGSGKSTLAKELCLERGLAHLDLDIVAWEDAPMPKRMPLEASKEKIEKFLAQHKGWVVEGCYTDLLEILVPESTEIIFLNLSVDLCRANAQQRPWEPHKYQSKQEQDANLDMLLEWIAQYTNRNDTFSFDSHRAFYDQYPGKKTMFIGNQRARQRSQKLTSKT
ncbi:MAG: shikimate kinase [Arenicella sp.]